MSLYKDAGFAILGMGWAYASSARSGLRSDLLFDIRPLCSAAYATPSRRFAGRRASPVSVAVAEYRPIPLNTAYSRFRAFFNDFHLPGNFIRRQQIIRVQPLDIVAFGEQERFVPRRRRTGIILGHDRDVRPGKLPGQRCLDCGEPLFLGRS